jgi:hypothetical protein
MAAILWTDITTYPGASGLSTVDIAAQATILGVVNGFFNVGAFGGEASADLKLARILLAAHIGTLSQRGAGAAGPVISSSAGGLSRTYAVFMAATQTMYGSTSYGSLLELLIRTRVTRLGTVA